MARQFGLQLFLLVISLFQFHLLSIASRNLIIDHTQTSNHLLLHYHNGTLLTGPITINLLWYGNFNPSQRAIISDFITSLSSSPENNQKQPSLSTWWKAIDKYYHFPGASPTASLSLSLSLKLGRQLLYQNYSLGNSLSHNQIVQLAAKANINNYNGRNAVNVVLTADDVAVEGFCLSKCGTHGYYSSENINRKNYKLAYIWIGNSKTQCPGYCAWPFHQSLASPNNDMGLDGMVANFAGLLAATVTNPFGNGYYQGEPDALLEAASACPGIYAKNAYPGYAGDLLVDPIIGASYNANGANGRRYLVPAIYDPITNTCSTLI